MSKLSAVMFTDGACSGNPGPGGWAYVMRVHDSTGKVDFALDGSGQHLKTTNNRMEMLAVIEALRALSSFVQQHKLKLSELQILTDSSYVLKGATEWIHGWKKRNWVKSDGEEVANQDIWQELEAELAEIPVKVRWDLLKGHSGFLGNEYVDELSVRASQGEEREPRVQEFFYFTEPAIFEKIDEQISKAKVVKVEKDKAKFKDDPKFGTWYYSYVKGSLLKHSTWADCEKRVKGVAGAKFKKVKSAAELEATLHSWGIKK